MSLNASQINSFVMRALEAASVSTGALQALGAAVDHVEAAAGGTMFVYFNDGSRAEVKVFHQAPLRRAG